MGLLALLAIGTGISAGTQVYGAIKGAHAAKRQGELEQDTANDQARLLEDNATLAEQQAQDAIARGAESEERFRQGVATIIGSQRAASAAANLDVNFGSALDIQHDAAYLGELDALTIRSNAAREAWGYRVDAGDLRKQAQIV